MRARKKKETARKKSFRGALRPLYLFFSRKGEEELINKKMSYSGGGKHLAPDEKGFRK